MAGPNGKYANSLIDDDDDDDLVDSYSYVDDNLSSVTGGMSKSVN